MAKKEVYNIDLGNSGSNTRSNKSRQSSNRQTNRGQASHSGKSGKKRMTKSQLRRRKRKRILIAEVIILLLVLAFLFVWLKLGRINWDDLKNLKVNKLDNETEEMLSGYTNIALFGVDNRSNGNYKSGNSDSIMVCSINNNTKEVKLISVYRDTCFDVDGKGTLRKCNYAYNHGGPEQAIEMLNRNLDLNIQKYVAVDFYALAEAVDAVGGIDIEIPGAVAEAMNGGGYIGDTALYTGGKAGYVSAGMQHVNGTQAVAFCRIRGVKGGDFGRAERQRQVLQAMVEAVKGASVGELNNLINSVFDDIGTNMKLKQILGMAAGMKDYKLSETRGFPFNMKTGNYGSQGDMNIPCTLESNVEELHKGLFGNEEFEPSKELKNVSKQIQTFTGLDENSALDYGY